MNQSRSVTVVIVSADQEWQVVTDHYSDQSLQKSPYGDCFETHLDGRTIIFMHGGWGKVSAAASAQYAIQNWSPVVLINLGTCGGFNGQIETGEIVLVEETLIYDIFEQMTDPQSTIEAYSVRLDLSWLKRPFPQSVRMTRMLSADRDILTDDIPHLKQHFGAVVADWESGAIAWVARRNGVRCLILRGVSDLVGADGGEAYGKIEVFERGARHVMSNLLEALPAWLNCIEW